MFEVKERKGISSLRLEIEIENIRNDNFEYPIYIEGITLFIESKFEIKDGIEGTGDNKKWEECNDFAYYPRIYKLKLILDNNEDTLSNKDRHTIYKALKKISPVLSFLLDKYICIQNKEIFSYLIEYLNSLRKIVKRTTPSSPLPPYGSPRWAGQGLQRVYPGDPLYERFDDSPSEIRKYWSNFRDK